MLLGVLTRSTVAALLLTLLFWFFVYAIGTAEQTVLVFKTMLPKTTETIDLLQRTLTRMADLPGQQDGAGDKRIAAVQRELAETVRSRSVAWIVGTSLCFELAVLAWAAILFCRRDY